MTSNIRSEFVAHEGIYLLAHSVGRPLVDAGSHANRFLTYWEEEAEPWPKWLNEIQRFRLALANLFGEKPENFCPQVNLSSALGKVLYSLPSRTNKKTLLLSELDFPSMGFVFDRAKALGYSLKFIPANADHSDIDTWSEYLTSDVHCALITHVYSNTGLKTPVEEVTSLCRQREITSVVDICQSAGVIPIQFAQWQADIILGSCVKWLCGGPGAGYLWLNPDLIRNLNPLDVGWFSHANPMEFDIHHFEFADDALRFFGGTPSVLPYMLASNSIEKLVQIEIENIREHNLGLTQYLADNIDPSWLLSPKEEEKRGGTTIIHAGEQQAELVNTLRSNGVVFDERKTGIRLSPHVYNSRPEIEQLVSLFNL